MSGVSGFVILPTDHPPIAVDTADTLFGSIRVTVGNTSTTLTAAEVRQLEDAIQRVRANQ